ncbi:MAG: 2-dehydropantoate 2-reductase [Acetobacteraceae bacterium]|nr:2-dehydropantoate 2-reductase [Acetobacteraceae bacterium]
MRVTVLGAGAVGGWLAAGLARAGHEVGILARGGSLVALRDHGLSVLEGERQEVFRLPATDDPAALRGADLLLLGLKSHDLPRALPLIEALLGPETLILPAQNGIPWWFLQGFGGPAQGLTLESVDPGGALARALPAERVIGCVAHVASRVEAPGRIRLVKADRLLLGDPGGAPGPRVAALVEAFRAGGVPAEAVPDIRAEIWLKLWGNSNMNPLSALCRADAAQMLDDPGVRGLVVVMMREMAEIGARIGLPIAQEPEERIAVTRRLGAFRTSMLQDLEAGRSLETGPLLGGLVELADHLGLEAPQLRGVHGLVRLLARNLGLEGAAPAG